MSNKKIIRALILTAVLLSTLVSLCACGLVNPAGCKHVLGGVNKKIDLGEMGYCIGSLGYKYCFHCNNTIINEGGMNISCDFDTTETSTGEGENGSNYRADRSECKICGLVLEKGIVEYFEPNCKKW